MPGSSPPYHNGSPAFSPTSLQEMERQHSSFTLPSPVKLCSVFSQRLQCLRTQSLEDEFLREGLSLLPEEDAAWRWVKAWGDYGLICPQAGSSCPIGP